MIADKTDHLYVLVLDKACGIIILIYVFFNVIFEIIQMKRRDTFMIYISEFWNAIDILNLGSLTYTATTTLYYGTENLPA